MEQAGEGQSNVNRAMARIRRLLVPLGVLVLAALLSPYLPAEPITLWLGVFAISAVLDFAVAEHFLRKGARSNRAAIADMLTQTVMFGQIASIALWAWSPTEPQTNGLILGALFLIFLGRLGRRNESLLGAVVCCSPLIAMLILAPWIHGSKVAAESTILFLVAFVCLLARRVRSAQQLREIDMLTEQQRDTRQQLAAAQIGLTQIKQEAEATQTAQRGLLAGLDADAHGPLDSMLKLTKALQEENLTAATEARCKQYAAEIHSHCLQLQDFAQDIADLGQLEDGTLAVKPACLDLQQLLAAVVQDCAARHWVSQIAFDVITIPDMPSLLADERLMRRMLMTLVANAVRETAPGGRVTIAALRLPDGGLGLRISSSGSGLSEADLERVFDCLISGRPEEFGADQHDALSIAIVKAFVERHGGDLSIRTRLGAGSQATLNFPPERLVSGESLTLLIDAA